jgi:hypothetical protein
LELLPALLSHDGTRPDVVVFNQLALCPKYSKQKNLKYLAFGMDRALVTA